MSKLSLLFLYFHCWGEEIYRIQKSRDLRVTMQNEFSTKQRHPWLSVDVLITSSCISIFTSVFSLCKAEGRWSFVIASLENVLTRRKIDATEGRGSRYPYDDIMPARLKRAYTRRRRVGCGGRNLRERASDRKEANSRRVSGGHLRLGHFVLSPCSVFTVVRRRKEATYAPVRSSLYPRDCIVL